LKKNDVATAGGIIALYAKTVKRSVLNFERRSDELSAPALVINDELVSKMLGATQREPEWTTIICKHNL
jgi:hypothetical protein